MLATTLILSKHNIKKQVQLVNEFSNACSPVSRILDVGIELETGDQALIHAREVVAENLQDSEHNVETADNEVIM